jgi:hypothetical protein
MTEEEIQSRLAEFKKAPRHVQAAALWSLVFGVVVLLRFQAAALTGYLSFGRAAFYGCLMLAWFWFHGHSLYDRSKWGFIAVAGFALLPFWGVFGHSIHLLRLVLEGSLAQDWRDTVLSLAGFIQLVVTFILFRQLLSKEVRRHVWQAPARPPVASDHASP